MGQSFPASCPVRYQSLQSSCQDERSPATGSSAWQRLCSPTRRIPLWHRERFQQLLWRERPRRTTATTSSSTTPTPASEVPAATIPTSAAVPTATTTAVPAPAPAAVPAATAVPAPTSPPACSIVQPTTNGCSSFQQHEAKAYCESMGMEPVSLDTPAKQDNFNRLIAQDAQRYFWTGGEVDHANEIVSWNNRNAKPIRFSESAHWSHTGGADLPQPDNRAAGENPPHPEVCLGILNNFYADGIKWHDVACHHKKPTVCEPRN